MGSGPNGAIIHYKASKKSNRKLKKGDIYLVLWTSIILARQMSLVQFHQTMIIKELKIFLLECWSSRA